MKRKNKRAADRHAGKRQTPFPHEHDLMARGRYPLIGGFGRPAEGSPAEEAGETSAQEATEQAAGQG